jgi:hypothetical protein
MTVLAYCACGGSIDAAVAGTPAVVCAGDPDCDSFWHRECYEHALRYAREHQAVWETMP